jgi:hypothetical protein
MKTFSSPPSILNQRLNGIPDFRACSHRFISADCLLIPLNLAEPQKKSHLSLGEMGLKRNRMLLYPIWAFSFRSLAKNL